MKKHNIGKISIIIVVLNVIFILIYFASKDAENVVVVNENKTINTSVDIYMDEGVDDKYAATLENIITDQKYEKEALSAVGSHDWYLTGNVVNTKGYIITNDKITIYVGNDAFETYVKDALNEIVN